MNSRRTLATPPVQRCHLDTQEQARLQEWADRIQVSIAHADTKSSILLGLSGTALAWRLTQAPAGGLLRAVRPLTGVGLLSAGAAITSLGLLAACVVVLVLAVRPDLSGEPVFGSPIGAGRLTAGEIAVLVAEAGREDATSRAVYVARLSQIATRKHQRIRTASTLLLTAFAALILAAGVGVTS